jgi:DNA-binding MarR family transcriptional regulator
MNEVQFGKEFLNNLYKLVTINRFFQNNFYDYFTSVSFPVLDIYILNYLRTGLVKTSRDFASALQLQKPMIDRALLKLEEAGYITASPKKAEDGYRITPLVQSTLDAASTRYDSHSSELFSRISTDDQQYLFSCWHAIGDAARVRTISIPNEHPSRASLRRLTIALGLLGNRFLGLPIAPSSWYILQYLAMEPEHQRTPSSMSEARNISRAGMTYFLKTAESRSWIVRQLSDSDLRSSFIHLGDEGLSFLATIEAQASSFLSKHLSTLSSEEVSRFLSVFGSVVGSAGPDLTPRSSKPAHQTIPSEVDDSETQSDFVVLTSQLIRSKEERDRYRSLLIKMLAAREVETEIPERLLDEKSVAVAASEHGQVVGLVQFRQQLDLSFKAEFMVPLEGEFATLNDRFLQMAVTRVGNELDGGRFSTLENIVYIR